MKPGDPGAGRKAPAHQIRLPLPRDGPEDQLARRLVEQHHRGGLGAEDRAGGLDDAVEHLGVTLLGAEGGGGDRGAQVVGAHPSGRPLAAAPASTAFTW